MDFNRYRDVLAERVGRLALPFDDDEYTRRRQGVADAMTEAGLAALLVTDAADICYLTGYNTFEVSVHTALLLTAPEAAEGRPQGRAVLQVPSIETGPAVTTARVDEVFGYRWEAANGAIDQMVGIISDLGLIGAGGGGRDVAPIWPGDVGASAGVARNTPRIGTDNWGPALRCGFRDGLATALPGVALIDASGLVDGVKIVKSEPEIALLRESARITETGIAAAESLIAPGVTDQQLAATGSAAMLAAGGEFMSLQPIVTAGWRSSVIHCNHQRHTVAEGDPVFLEFGAAWHRYTAPMMRTRIAGTPSDEMRRTAGVIRDIYEALTANMRPGVTMDAAAAAADAALAPMAERAFFSGVYGYTVGIQFPPSWVEASGYIARGVEREFTDNMVFHLPLMLRLPGEWGIGMSNTVRVTADGGEALTNNDLALMGVAG
ncbi:M24 family metallopeptidase [Spiribacter onubensis]|uniref:Xaa-Pro peptidase family protein n=1 Tax=Spiribacter onubensis TaxID=3122420 RepID=A0ABV3SCF4_9GAMM